MVRSEHPGWRCVLAAAVYQRGDHVLEHDPVRHPGRWQPHGWSGQNSGRSDPDQGSELDPRGSVSDAGSRGTDSPGDHQDFSNPMITAGPCLYLHRHAATTALLYCRTALGGGGGGEDGGRGRREEGRGEGGRRGLRWGGCGGWGGGGGGGGRREVGRGGGREGEEEEGEGGGGEEGGGEGGRERRGGRGRREGGEKGRSGRGGNE